MATEYYLVPCCQLNIISHLVYLLFLRSLFLVFKSLIFNIFSFIHVVIPVIHLLPSCYAYAKPESIMLQNLPDMLFDNYFPNFLPVMLVF